MHKLGIFSISLILFSQSAFINTALAETKDIAPGKQHPLISGSAALALHQVFHSGMLDSGLLAQADFSLALTAPKYSGNEGAAASAGLLILSLALKTDKGPQPSLYSAAWSHTNKAIRNQAKPWVESWAGQFGLEEHTESLSYLAPAAVNAIPAFAYYGIKGNFDGFWGIVAKRPATKTAFVLFDGLEKANAEILTKLFGQGTWVEPAAQLETGAILAISSYHAQLFYSFPLLASEAAAQKTTNSGFNFIKNALPAYAPYINPALAGALIYSLSLPRVSNSLEHHPILKSASIGVALAAFAQIFGAAFDFIDYYRTPESLVDHI